MFQMRARNATAVARPVKMSGVDLTSVSVTARQDPNPPVRRAAKADAGLAPAARNRSAHTRREETIAAAMQNARFAGDGPLCHSTRQLDVMQPPRDAVRPSAGRSRR